MILCYNYINVANIFSAKIEKKMLIMKYFVTKYKKKSLPVLV